MRSKNLLRRQIIWLFLRTPIVVGITAFGLRQSNNRGLDKETNEVFDFETGGREGKDAALPERQMFLRRDDLSQSFVPEKPASVTNKHRKMKVSRVLSQPHPADKFVSPKTERR